MAPPEIAPESDLPTLIRHHEHFIVITLHSSSASASAPSDFLSWLAQCSALLCHEIHATIPHLRLVQHPSILAPAGAPGPNPQTLRCLIGAAQHQTTNSPLHHDDDDDAPTLATRLTCGLQAFLNQLRLHPMFLKTTGLWLNARYVKRADVSEPENLIDYYHHHSPTTPADTSANATDTHTQQPPTPPPLPSPALSAIAAALRITPDPPSPTIVPHSSLQPPPTSPSQPKAKLRPVSDVLDRLRWDASLGGAAAYAVGYRDRFDGVLELSLERLVAESTAEDWIPLHRVSYVKRRGDGALVWWREGRVDLVFGSGNGGGADAEC